MPEEGRDTAELRFKYWAGTVEQLVRAAEHAAEEVAGLAPYPEGYDPDDPDRDSSKYGEWLKADAARKISIVIAEKGGFTARPASLKALSQISEADLESVEDITISIGDWVPLVTIRTGKSWTDALSVVIEGYERTWTAGLRHELSSTLKPQGPLHFPLMTLGNPGWLAAIATIPFWAILIGLDQLLRSGHKLTPASRISASFGAALLWVVAVTAVVLASKGFELLPAAGRPRYQRWRAKALGGAGVIVGGLIVTAIWAAITS